MTEVIKLFGIGGNLKTSITSSTRINDLYTPVFEGNRDLDAFLYKYGDWTTVTRSLGMKWLMTSQMIKLSNRLGNLITDRSLIDSAIMNELIKTKITHYAGADTPWLSLADGWLLEDEMYCNCNCKNILLLTTDPKFIDHLFNNGDKIRSKFFLTPELYLECQDYYKRVILDKYLSDILVIELSDLSDIKYTIDSTITRILNYAESK